MNICAPRTSRRPVWPVGSDWPSSLTTLTCTPSSGRPSEVDDLSAARDGSVSVLESDSVMPQSEQTFRSSSRAARSISTGGIGAPPHRNERNCAGRGAPAATVSTMSDRNGVDAAV